VVLLNISVTPTPTHQVLITPVGGRRANICLSRGQQVQCVADHCTDWRCPAAAGFAAAVCAPT
jgi:hypothetical protein